MQRAIFTLFKQDIVLTWRAKLILVTVITLAIIVALYWTLPLMMGEELTLGGSQVYLDQSNGRIIESYVSETAGGTIRTVADRAELEEIVRSEDGTIGVVVTGSATGLVFDLVFKSPPPAKNLAVIQAALTALANSATGTPHGDPVRVETLREPSAPLAANQTLIAVMMAFEVMILGFLFIAVVVFGEKREGSIRAYRISPSGLANYVVSKTLVFTVLSTLYGLIMVLVTVGPRIDLGALTAVLILSCALMTLLGLGVAVFFENLSQWFVPGVLVLSINMLAVIPYQIPSYSLSFQEYLPGYNVIFAVSEILFSTGKQGFLGPVLARLGIGTAIAAVFAAFAVRRKLLKEA